VSTHQLIIRFREYQVADLRACIYGTYRLQSLSVPKTNVLVSSATAGCKKATMKWTPVDGFYSGAVLAKPS
jgi:hypothetical protein